MKTFPVVILAGGLATRLRPLTEKIPKSLVELNGEPFVAHQMRLLKKQSVQEIIMCAGHLGEMLQDYLGDGSQFGMNVQYVFDGEKRLGTGGAIKNAWHLLPENFFVLYGDSYLTCDFLKVQQAFLAKKKLGLMTVFKNEGQWDTSNVEFAADEIKVYDKVNRTPAMHYIDYGLGIFQRDAFAEVPQNESYDLATLYQTLLKKNELSAYEVKERFYEVGSFAGLEELEYHLMQI